MGEGDGAGDFKRCKIFFVSVRWKSYFPGHIYFLARICRNIFFSLKISWKFFFYFCCFTFLMVHPVAGTHCFVCSGDFIQRLHVQHSLQVR